MEKHDKERLFLNIIETGVLGKVFSILAAPADSIRQNRDLTLARKQISEEQDVEEQKTEEPKDTFIHKQEKPQKMTSELSESARRLFINTFTRKKTETKEAEPAIKEQNEPKDPLSLAFAKSFGSEEEPEKEEPRLEPSLSFLAPDKEEEEIQPVFEKEPEQTEEPEDTAPKLEVETESTPELTISEIIVKEEQESKGLNFEEAASIIHADLEGGFTKATASLSDMNQEWEEAKQRDLKAQKEVENTDEGMPEPKISNDGDYSYPFGGWMNADNYK